MKDKLATIFDIKLLKAVLLGRRELISNLISFAVFGGSVALLSLLIPWFYSPADFGIFNLVYTLFLILGQFVGLGLHFSVLTSTALHTDDEAERCALLQAALLALGTGGVAVLVVLWIFKDIFLVFFETSENTLLLALLLPGLLAFNFNKVLLAYLNGLRRMISYAVFYAWRGLMMLFLGTVFCLLKISSDYFSLIFTLAEGILGVSLLWSTRYDVFKRTSGRNKWQLARSHLRFGMKAAPGSIIIDINTRVDVLMLGWLSSARSVGIYSFALVFVDAIQQLAIVLRTLVNPRITTAYRDGSAGELQSLLRSFRTKSYWGLSLVSCASIGAVYLVVYILGYTEYRESIEPFLLLTLAMILVSGYFPLMMIFNQTAMPGRQSVLYLVICTTNVIANFILVPDFGVAGAAVATGLSWIMMAAAIKLMARRSLAVSV